MSVTKKHAELSSGDFVYSLPNMSPRFPYRWWSTEGCRRRPRSTVSVRPGYRRLWIERIQSEICNRYGITVSVSHYPTGASQCNPIELRLFSEISKNWAGRPTCLQNHHDRSPHFFLVLDYKISTIDSRILLAYVSSATLLKHPKRSQTISGVFCS
jgi:hypothetical protein